MTRKVLMLRGLGKMLSGILLMGLLLFLPAGTMDYSGAWQMLAILFLPMLLLGAFLFFRDPTLLEKRLNSREKEDTQKAVILLSALLFTASFLLCGFDRRFGWSRLPRWVSILGCALFLLSYLGFVIVLRTNAYLSRTVEVQAGQKVVDSGVYAIVRHPMYTVILVLYFSMPLVIGSLIGLIPLVAMPLVLAARIKNEEKVLEEGLPGYLAYEQKVRWRMLPLIW